MTKNELATLKDIAKRSKNWPVGVPVKRPAVAEALLNDGYLEYAAPAYNYPNNPPTYRLTVFGEVAIKMSST